EATQSGAVTPETLIPKQQYFIKESVYQCMIAATGLAPPWGNVSGVRPVKIPTRMMREAGQESHDVERILQEKYHITPLRAQLATTCAKKAIEVQDAIPDHSVSLYVGIPFCPSRCHYCSFTSSHVGDKLIADFFDGLLSEIEITAKSTAPRTIHTLYIGGGTPTILSEHQLEILLAKLGHCFDLTQCKEITVEAGRPDTLSAQKLTILRKFGVDRICLNPQSMNDAVLQALGRNHTAQDIKYWYSKVEGMQVNMDLIAGLPSDTFESFCNSLEQVIALKPHQITVHTLAVKKGANITVRNELSSLLPSEIVLKMVDYAWERLQSQDYAPYYLYRQKYMSGGFENVGWCREDAISHYNVIMMEELDTVVGVGGGGMTKVLGQGRFERVANPKYPHDYLRLLDEILSKKNDIFRSDTI
ncbi:MAG: coproporphyrinogen dehydrogenase HemZ, partial [Eubacteriales bacterium]